MTKRLALVLALVVAGLCSAFLVPNRTDFQPTGVNMDLPANRVAIAGKNGRLVTTLLQTAILSSQFQVVGGLINDLEVSDLTIDCNYLNLGPTLNAKTKSIGALSAISGHFNNVSVIHAGGTVETFALGFCQYGTNSIPPDSVLIENCQVTQSGPNVTAIYASNSQTDDNSDTIARGGQATIRNCYV